MEKSDSEQNHSDSVPKPMLPVRALRWLQAWWTDPHRLRGNFAEHLTVAVSIVVAGIALLQWGVYRQQKKIMESSGHQTDQLITAANIQAVAAQKIADASNRNAKAAEDFATAASNINSQMIDAVKKLNAQASATQDSANAAKSAANTARDSLVIGNRPWIKVDLWQTAPLEFLPDGSAKIGIQEKIENVGSSVALRVESWFDMFPLGSTPNTFLAAKVKQKEGCDAIRFPKFTILEGEEMFPHDPMLLSYAVPIPKNHIVPIKDNAMEGKVGQVGFILAGCVSYRSSFEDSMVPSHETLFEYWIAKPVERGALFPFSILLEVIPITALCDFRMGSRPISSPVT